MTSTEVAAQTVVIAGAGPCGLAAALALHQAGWRRITLLERNASATTFDKNKGFNYLIDARGQKLLRTLGIADRLAEYGVENQRNVMTLVQPDGEQKVFKSPFWDPARDSAWWSRRERFQALLSDRIEEINDGRIDLRYGHEFVDLAPGDAATDIITRSPDGTNETFEADLLLGCDGLKSKVRLAMAAHGGVPESRFDRHQFPSPSSVLYYKVLSMPAVTPLRLGDQAADDHRMGYAYLARHKDPRQALALVSYPVATPDEPRTVNVIRLPDHEVWEQEDPEALLAFLDDAFPQLPVRDVLTAEEAADFVGMPPGRFPSPQYTEQCHAVVGPAAAPLACVLLGDAAHAFPPDLGLGVNTALEDVGHLLTSLADAGNLPAAVRQYDESQASERRALVKLVQTVAPYQYNHRPTALKLWALRFFGVTLLHRLLPFFIDRPAVLLAQQDELPFSEIRRRQVNNRWKIGGLLTAVGAAVAVLLS
ncbi:MAG: NAD(P)/FAD-dependent oxidoreductase [Pseudomonadota bacterium]